MGIGLFKEDKLLFALHILRAVNPDLIPKKEFDFFLRNIIDDTQAPSFPAWLPDDKRAEFSQLINIIPHISNDIYSPSWNQWFTNFDCEKKFPSELKPFQKVILV